jgi:hypothetical protein
LIPIIVASEGIRTRAQAFADEAPDEHGYNAIVDQTFDGTVDESAGGDHEFGTFGRSEIHCDCALRKAREAPTVLVRTRHRSYVQPCFDPLTNSAVASRARLRRQANGLES